MFRKTILMLMCCLLLTVPAFAKEASEKTTVQVSGTSQLEVTPDIARISIVVNSIQSNLEQARNENAQLTNQLIAGLKEQGITEQQIKTNTYHIDPIYNYEKDRLPKLKGYRATTGLEASVPVDQVGVIISDVTSGGANEIHSVRFERAKEADVKSEALQKAVEDAMHKAQVIAGALNKRVANVKMVNESDSFYHPVMLESRAMKAGNADAVVPNLPSGKVTVGANVQLTVELE